MIIAGREIGQDAGRDRTNTMDHYVLTNGGTQGTVTKVKLVAKLLQKHKKNLKLKKEN